MDEFVNKEVIVETDGFRESEQSWKEVLLDLKYRGLTQEPKIVIGDGVVGFWKGIFEPQISFNRCLRW